MKIVTTPLCRDILELAGIKEYEINLDPDSTDADIAVVLSETKTRMKSVRIKLNTFSQISESVELIREIFRIENSEYEIEIPEINPESRLIKVKVYSNFLRDIVEEMGFTIVNKEENPHYIVYPDYLRSELAEEIGKMAVQTVEVPSHKNASINPIKRAEMRYKLLENKLCMKP